MPKICTIISFVCHSYELVYHSHVLRTYSYVIRMSLVCTRMSLICVFTMNHWASYFFTFSKVESLLLFLSKKAKFDTFFRNCPFFLLESVKFTTFSFETVKLATFSFKTVELAAYFNIKVVKSIKFTTFLSKAVYAFLIKDCLDQKVSLVR